MAAATPLCNRCNPGKNINVTVQRAVESLACQLRAGPTDGDLALLILLVVCALPAIGITAAIGFGGPLLIAMGALAATSVAKACRSRAAISPLAAPAWG